jgi:hypothetical protein
MAVDSKGSLVAVVISASPAAMRETARAWAMGMEA